MAQKIAIVTGANKGIGLSVVKQLCQQRPDWLVYLTARDAERGRAAVEQLKRDHAVSPVFHQLDVTSPTSCKTLAEFLQKNHPQGISVLVNNAGAMTQLSQEKFTLDRSGLENVINVNYFGVINVCQQLFPLLAEQSARVVNVSSRLAQMVFSQFSDSLKKTFENLKNQSTFDELSSLMSEFCKLPEDDFQRLGWCQVAFSEKVPQWNRFAGQSIPYGVSKLALNVLTVVQQKQLERLQKLDVAVNACTPGSVLTDMNSMGVKTADEAAQIVVYLALLSTDGGDIPRGQFVDDHKTVCGVFTL